MLFYHEECVNGENQENKENSGENNPEKYFQSTSIKDFMCNDCRKGIFHCFACSDRIESEDGDRQLTKCSDPKCGRHFHFQCLANLTNVIYNEKEKNYKCPHHVCHSCATKVKDEESKGSKTNEFYQSKVFFISKDGNFGVRVDKMIISSATDFNEKCRAKCFNVSDVLQRITFTVREGPNQQKMTLSVLQLAASS